MLHPRDFKSASEVITTIVNSNGKNKSVVVDFANTPQCRNKALFLHALPTALAVIGTFVLMVIAAILTGVLRNHTPGIEDGSKTPAKPVEVEMSVIPASTEAETETTDEEQPPPYQAPETQPTETPAAIATPAKPTTPAERFVRGTFLLLLILTILVLIALCIQNVLQCSSGSSPLIFHFFFWVLYAFLLLWASVGVGCWVILVRDLWGPHAKKRFPVNECLLPMVVFGGLLCLCTAPAYFIYKGAVWAVEACQKRCCGVGEADGDEDGVAAGDGEPDSEEARRLVAPEPDRDVEIAEENEDAAFLRGGSKA